MEQTVKVTPKAAVADIRLPNSSIGLEVLPLQGFLSVDLSDSKASEQLGYVRSQFGKDVPVGDILQELRQIEIKLGTPKLGETRLGKIYNYLRSVETVKNAEKLRDSYLQ